MDPVKVSIRPSTFVEGGAVPVDKNLTWKECRFAKFQYTKKDGSVVMKEDGVTPVEIPAARITYVDDDGAEFIQHYSAGDLERFTPSKDGKTLVAVGGAQALSKSSNYYILMNALINAGFPEDKMDDDISVLDGLKTFNIGIPEPKRSGLKRNESVEGARERTLSVPSQIIQLPWEKKGKAPTAKGAKTETSGADVAKDALAIVETLLKDADSTTRQKIATQAIRDKKTAVAKIVFTDEFQVALLSGGYTLDGDTVTKA